LDLNKLKLTFSQIIANRNIYTTAVFLQTAIHFAEFYRALN